MFYIQNNSTDTIILFFAWIHALIWHFARKITLKQCWLWRWLVIPSEEIHFSDLVNMIQLKTIGKTSIFRHENVLKFCPNWISTMCPWDAFGVLKLLPYNTIQCMENIVQSIRWRSSPMKLSLSCSTTPPLSYFFLCIYVNY